VSYRYSTSAPAVATVNAAAVVSAVSSGTATITVSATGSGNGFLATSLERTIEFSVSANAAVLGLGFDDAQFALIPAGAFAMGTDTGEFIEGPQRTVTISRAFLVQKTEVTRGQWQQVMQGTGLVNPFSGSFSNCGATCPAEGGELERHPAVPHAVERAGPGPELSPALGSRVGVRRARRHDR
jgi:formylglycine-generating enzyme required for sulfatase activity